MNSELTGGRRIYVTNMKMQDYLFLDQDDPMERCRLCACHCSPDEKVDIFSEEGRSRALEEKMRACLPLESQVMLVADRLPKSVCCTCVELLEKFHLFRQDCLSASLLLRTCLERYNARPTKVGGQQRTDACWRDLMPTLEPQSLGRSTEESRSVGRPHEGNTPMLPALVPISSAICSRTVPSDSTENHSEGLRAFVSAEGTSLLKETLLRGERVRKRLRSVGADDSSVVASGPAKKSHISSANEDGPKADGGSRRKSAKPRKIARADVDGPEEDSDGILDLNQFDPSPFCCILCDQSFETKSGLGIHLNIHHGINVTDTNGSESSFRSSSYMTNHSLLPRKCKLEEELNSPKLDVSKIKNYDQDIECIEVDGSEPSCGDGFLSCELCLRTFADKQSLWLHFLYTHKEEAPYACGLCLKLFKNNTELSKHWKGHYKNQCSEQSNYENPEYFSLERRYSCEICGRQDNSKKKLINHMKVHVFDAGINPESLVIVNADFYNANSHRLEFTDFADCSNGVDRSSFDGSLGGGEDFTNSANSNYFPCTLCFKAFESEATLAKHKKNSHRMLQECDVCFAQFQSELLLTEHMCTCHGVKVEGGAPTSDVRDNLAPMKVCGDILYCKYCSKQFTNMKSLDSHQRQCKNSSSLKTSDILSYHCEVCHKSFVSEDCLVKHKKGAHKQKQMDSSVDGSPMVYNSFYFCEICGSSHATKIERWRHVNGSHADEESIRCNHKNCEKIFSSESLCVEHRSHHGVQGAFPNTCEICGRLSDSRVEFWKHVQGVHAEMLPFVCGICLKMFNATADLMEHIGLKHKLQKENFHCRVCARQYSNQAKCTRHEVIHRDFDFESLGMSVPEDTSASKSKKSLGSSKSKSKANDGVKSTPMTKSVILNMPKIAPKLAETSASSWVSNDVLQTYKKEAPVLFCDVCPQMDDFESELALAHHRRSVHNLHPCDLCQKFYGRGSHLWKHVNKKHRGHPDITCQVCTKVSATKVQLGFHMKKHHKIDLCSSTDTSKSTPKKGCSETNIASVSTNHILTIPSFQVGQNSPQQFKTYDCPHCYKSFIKCYMLRKHQKYCRKKLRKYGQILSTSDSDPPKYSCTACDIQFDVKQKMIEHNRSMHKTSPCENCETVWPTQAELFQHIKSCHVELKCHVCGRFTRSPADFKMHKEQHESLDHPLYCELCGEVMSNVARVWVHFNCYHKEDIPYFCGVCFARLSDTDSLINHVQKEHSSALEVKNACKICAKVYCSNYRVTDHVNKYHEGYVACKECLIVFKNKAELNAHSEEVHKICETTIKEDNQDVPVANSNDKSDKLDEDGESTVDQGEIIAEHNLDSAASKARVKRSYNCDQCSLTFSRPSFLYSHKKYTHLSRCLTPTGNSEPSDDNSTEDEDDPSLPEQSAIECPSCHGLFKQQDELTAHKCKLKSECQEKEQILRLTASNKRNMADCDTQRQDLSINVVLVTGTKNLEDSMGASNHVGDLSGLAIPSSSVNGTAKGQEELGLDAVTDARCTNVSAKSGLEIGAMTPEEVSSEFPGSVESVGSDSPVNTIEMPDLTNERDNATMLREDYDKKYDSDSDSEMPILELHGNKNRCELSIGSQSSDSSSESQTDSTSKSNSVEKFSANSINDELESSESADRNFSEQYFKSANSLSEQGNDVASGSSSSSSSSSSSDDQSDSESDSCSEASRGDAEASFTEKDCWNSLEDALDILEAQNS